MRSRWASCVVLAMSLGWLIFVGSQWLESPQLVMAARRGQPAFICAPRLEGEGSRRALLIGVGNYAAKEINDLEGPPKDVDQLAEMLLHGYGFERRDICTLKDEEATRSRVRRAIQSHLIESARPGDDVVIYFSGHGSQVEDESGDESDLLDEVWLLHDSLMRGPKELIDDEVAEVLAQLEALIAPGKVTIILDSCHSGTGARALGTPRSHPGPPGTRTQIVSRTLLSDELIVSREPRASTRVLSASVDGGLAYEREGGGLFTQALLMSMAEYAGRDVELGQLWASLTQHLAAHSSQIASLSGELHEPFLGSSEASSSRGPVWQVTTLQQDSLSFKGLALPGFGEGARLRVFDGATLPADLASGKGAKGEVVLNRVTARGGYGDIVARAVTADPIGPGDIATLVSPGGSFVALKFGFGVGEKALPRRWRSALQEALSADPDTRFSILEGPVNEGYSLVLEPERGEVAILGPEGSVRRYLGAPACVCSVQAAQAALRGFARQRRLLQLRGEGFGHLQNDRSLSVELIGEQQQSLQKPIPGALSISACRRFRFRVSRSGSSKEEWADVPLQTALLSLSNDGGVYVYEAALLPGESVVLPRQGTATSCGPFYVWESIMAIGHLSAQPLPWSRLTSPSVRVDRDFQGATAALFDGYLTQNWRAMIVDVQVVDTTPWTTTHLKVLVEPNPDFFGSGALLRAPVSVVEDLKLSGFFMAPYLSPGVPSGWKQTLQAAVARARETTLRGDVAEKASSASGYSQVKDLAPVAARLRSKPEIRAASLGSLLPGDLLITRPREPAGGPTIWTLVVDPELGIGFGSLPGDASTVPWMGFHKLFGPEEYQVLGYSALPIQEHLAVGYDSASFESPFRLANCAFDAACRSATTGSCHPGSKSHEPLKP